jgi:hypothetical protein
MLVVLAFAITACDLDTADLSNAERRVRKEAKQAQRELRKVKREARQGKHQALQERRQERRTSADEGEGEKSEDCTPGYSPCLPPASDYDCASGTGDGPEYAHGEIAVSGADPYDLDSDGDGFGCES